VIAKEATRVFVMRVCVRFVADRSGPDANILYRRVRNFERRTEGNDVFCHLGQVC
jgi:hypothetical protein